MYGNVTSSGSDCRVAVSAVYEVSIQNEQYGVLGGQFCHGNEMFKSVHEFEVLTAVVMKSTVFWDITPCSPLSVN
jgi:hypothetical protein